MLENIHLMQTKAGKEKKRKKNHVTHIDYKNDKCKRNHITLSRN